MSIKDKLIRIGNKHPDLRSHIKVILSEIDFDNKKGNQGLPKDSKFFSKSPEIMKAFNQVILPQIEMKIKHLTFEDMSEMMKELELLGQSNNVELEDSLIMYKPISMARKKFFDEIRSVFEHYMKNKFNGDNSGDNSSEGEGGKKEYNFTFK